MGAVAHLRRYPSLVIPRRRVELVSTGIDEALQGLAGDPYGGTSSIGLRVPALVTHGPTNRFLFLLCTANFPEACNVWLRGFRMGWSLGTRLDVTGPPAGPRVVEQWVTTPNFKLPDGNISWHMRLMGKNEPYGRPPLQEQRMDPLTGGNQQNLAFRDSAGPGLLFNTVATPTPFYVQLTAYTPPLGGKPPGEGVTGELDTFYDLKTRWDDAHDWNALDIRLQGPCRIAFYASVQQTNPDSQEGRVRIPAPNPFFEGGLSPEEQFLLNFPTAIIWRVAGALVFEIDDPEE